jgi:hypothetical protein
VNSSLDATPIRRIKKADRRELFRICYIARDRGALLFVIHSIIVADLLFVIEDNQEKGRMVKEGTKQHETN